MNVPVWLVHGLDPVLVKNIITKSGVFIDCCVGDPDGCCVGENVGDDDNADAVVSTIAPNAACSNILTRPALLGRCISLQAFPPVGSWNFKLYKIDVRLEK